MNTQAPTHPLEVETLVSKHARRPVEIALDMPKPWPSSEAEDIARAEAEFHGPAQMRKTSEVSRLLSLLDEIGSGKDGPA